MVVVFFLVWFGFWMVCLFVLNHKYYLTGENVFLRSHVALFLKVRFNCV